MGPQKPSVLVLGGQYRNTLGIVRDFGRLGIPVCVGGDRRLARSLWSRYAARRFTYPPVAQGLEGSHQHLLEKVREWRPDVMLPMLDDCWRLVYAFYDEHAEFTQIVPCPGRELFERMLDKTIMTSPESGHGRRLWGSPASLRVIALDSRVDFW